MDYSCANRALANLAPALSPPRRKPTIERRLGRTLAASAVTLACLAAGCAPENGAGPSDGSGSSVPPGSMQDRPDPYHLRPSNMEFG
jgi:hypothetical protein